MVYDTV